MVLDVQDVSVRFGGVVAVDGVGMTVADGEVTGLIGPNGAGKTTLFNVITGLQQPTAGRVLLDGQDVTSLSATRRAWRGIARTFQRLELFGSLTAYENVLAAAETRRRRARESYDPAAVADEIIDRVGLAEVADERADALSTGLARLVELGRALATKPRLLLLDEAASGLDETETGTLAALLRELAREGIAILLVEHDVDLVMSMCSTVHVMDTGRVIAVGSPADVQSDALVQHAYLGSDVSLGA